MLSDSEKPDQQNETIDLFLRKFQKELNAGTLSLVLLGVLDRAKEELYGYQIAKLLEKAGGGRTMFKQGALYPVLRGMSANGLLSSRVEPSTSGPPRRYYRITGSGRLILTKWWDAWQAPRDFVDTLMNAKDEK
ncbi:MAG: PadR family transcriptional regulator [Gammaproteobacteria bacterium]|nr:PadR family transcriptional regulator [Gammaproteobacteria bacterium]